MECVRYPASSKRYTRKEPGKLHDIGEKECIDAYEYLIWAEINWECTLG